MQVQGFAFIFPVVRSTLGLLAGLVLDSFCLFKYFLLFCFFSKYTDTSIHQHLHIVIVYWCASLFIFCLCIPWRTLLITASPTPRTVQGAQKGASKHPGSEQRLQKSNWIQKSIWELKKKKCGLCSLRPREVKIQSKVLFKSGHSRPKTYAVSASALMDLLCELILPLWHDVDF